MRLVVDEPGLADFVTVNADAYATYGMPAEVFTDIFDQPANLLGDDDAAVVVAYRGERPVAAALTYVSHGIASLQWVGTVAATRQRGLGRHITQCATNVAFERGATTCTLQASADGRAGLRQARLRDVVPLPELPALGGPARLSAPLSGNRHRPPAVGGRPVGRVDQAVGDQRLAQARLRARRPATTASMKARSAST